jgi:spermidine synthase
MKSFWFTQKFAPFEKPFIKSSVLVKRKIFSKKTPYQKLEIFDTNLFGKYLVLDGITQTTEKDEFFYHEMMVHLPFLYHGNAKKVLIIGGGDGGILKQALKYPIEEAHLAEIDKDVIDATIKYMPSLWGKSFEDRRSKIFIGDGLKFVKKFRNYFDITILDLTDPSGPSKFLYSTKFYKDVKNALKKDGIVLTQSGTFPSMIDDIQMVKKNLSSVFRFVKTHLGIVPSFGIGLNSYTIASGTSLEIDLKTLQNRYKKFKLDTKYYTPELHLSSGFLPQF